MVESVIAMSFRVIIRSNYGKKPQKDKNGLAAMLMNGIEEKKHQKVILQFG